jgi:hypothetical protein
MIAIWKSASLFVRLLLIALVIALIGWGVTALFGGKTAKVEADLGRERTGAAIQSGADAVNTVGDVEAESGERARSGEQVKGQIRDAKDARAGDVAARDWLCKQSPDLCPKQPMQQASPD